MILKEFIDEISTDVLVNKKRVTLFIGSGFSRWFGYPLWNGLLKSYCNSLMLKYPKKSEFILGIRDHTKAGVGNEPEAFKSLIKDLELDALDVKKFIKYKFEDIKNINKDIKLKDTNIDLIKYNKLYKLSEYCKIITTNYDTLIEDIFKEKYNIKTNVYYSDDIMLNRDFFNSGSKTGLLKMHGCVNREDLMIVLEDDYTEIRFDDKFKILRQSLKNDFSSNITIFLGYSITDENIRELLIENKEIFGDDKEKSYVFNTKTLEELKYIMDNPEKLESIYKDIGVEEIVINDHDELITVLDTLSNLYNITNSNKIENNNNTVCEKDESVDVEKVGLVIYCYNNKLYNQARILAEEILEYAGNITNKYMKSTVYMYIGAILAITYQMSTDQDLKNKGNIIIRSLCEFNSNNDFILELIGNLYLCTSAVIKYDSTIYNTFGVESRHDINAINEGLKYLEQVKSKSDEINFNIMRAYCIKGDLSKANKFSKQIKNTSKYYIEKDLILGHCYFQKYRSVYTLDGKNKKLSNQYISTCIKYYSRYLDNIELEKYDRLSIADIFSKLIECNIKINNYIEARKYCNILIDFNPQDRSIYKSIILISAKEGKYEEAIEACNYELNHLKNEDIQKHRINYIKAQCIFAKAKYKHEVEESIQICKYIQSRFRYFDVAVSMSNMYKSIGYLEEMRNACIDAYKIYPLNKNIYNATKEYMLGHFAGEEGNYTLEKSFDGIMWMEKYKSDFLKSNNSKKEIDYILEGDKLYTKVSSSIGNKTIEEEINIDDLIMSLGHQLSEDDIQIYTHIIGDYNNCKYNMVLMKINENGIDVNNFIIKFIYANSLVHEKNYEKGLKIYKEISKNYMHLFKNDKKKVIYLYQGHCYLELGRYIEANNSYFESYNLDKEFSSAIFGIAVSKLQLFKTMVEPGRIKQLQMSKDLFQEYLSIENYNPTVYIYLRDICYMLGDLDGSISAAIRSQMFNINNNQLLKSYIMIISGYLFKEDKEKIQYYVDLAERLISNYGYDNFDSKIKSDYYCIKGVYYKGSNSELCIDSFRLAYALNPDDFNKNNLDNELNGCNHIEIKYKGHRIICN